MKTEELSEIPLLKRFSSNMDIPPYNRLTALKQAVKILEKLVQKCQVDGETIPESRLL